MTREAEPARRATRETVQRRTVTTLVTSQVVGGLGVSGGVAVGALLATEVLGSEDLAGFAQSAQVLGAALLALPAARLGRGVRPAGRAGVRLRPRRCRRCRGVVAGQVESFPLLLIGTALFGGGTAAGLQARFAATDLAPAEPGRGRCRSWCGRRRSAPSSVPTWSARPGALAREIGIEPLAGPFLVGAVSPSLAWLVATGLRPDPLVVARSLQMSARARQPARRDQAAG